MTFRWSSYLELARELANVQAPDPASEAKMRSAISRAYYAAFCEARNYVRDVAGLAVPRDASAHAYVRKAFSRSTDPLRRSVGNSLIRLRESRRRADYEDQMANPREAAVRAVQTASRVLSVLASL